MSKPILVFDMDGVLVDVTESYRETIARTVQHFTGRETTRLEIQEYKNQGGWNDDWLLSHQMVKAAGIDVPFEEVKDRFQHLFRGNGADGLILREQWVAKPGLLEKLADDFQFALFTGRPREEAEITLARFARALSFDPIIAMEDVEQHKPAPEGLLRILGEEEDGFYIGDTVDDARCARAANVPFIGVTAPSNPTYVDLVFLFQAEGAYAIVDNINFLPEVFTA